MTLRRKPRGPRARRSSRIRMISLILMPRSFRYVPVAFSEVGSRSPSRISSISRISSVLKSNLNRFKGTTKKVS